ncbi:protein kinase [Pelomyxa schiedti]|nr:protein kinase [Pelomyxa schiedti]
MRYVVLTSHNELIVFMRKRKGEKELRKIQLDDPNMLACLGQDHPLGVSPSLCFCINSKEMCFHLAAVSEQERDSWIAEINNALTTYFPEVWKATMKQALLTFLVGFYHPRASVGSVLKCLPEEIVKNIGRLLFQEIPVLLSDFRLVHIIKRESSDELCCVQHIPSKKYFSMRTSKTPLGKPRKPPEQVQYEFIHSPFVAAPHYSYGTPEYNYFIFDYFAGGELFHHLSQAVRFDAPVVKIWAAELLLALEHLHNLPIIFRDLKPEEIFVSKEGHVCLLDLRLAKLLRKGETTSTFCGTPEYMAPEILRGEGYGVSVDWWSLGILLYELRTGVTPFNAPSVPDLFARVMSQSPTFPPGLSPEEIDFISKLLAKNPVDRLCDPALMKQHPFFQGICWADILNRTVIPPYAPSIGDPENPVCVSPNIASVTPTFTPSHLTARTQSGHEHNEDFSEFSCSSDDDE